LFEPRRKKDERREEEGVSSPPLSAPGSTSRFCCRTHLSKDDGSESIGLALELLPQRKITSDQVLRKARENWDGKEREKVSSPDISSA